MNPRLQMPGQLYLPWLPSAVGDGRREQAPIMTQQRQAPPSVFIALHRRSPYPSRPPPWSGSFCFILTRLSTEFALRAAYFFNLHARSPIHTVSDAADLLWTPQQQAVSHVLLQRSAGCVVSKASHLLFPSLGFTCKLKPYSC